MTTLNTDAFSSLPCAAAVSELEKFPDYNPEMSFTANTIIKNQNFFSPEILNHTFITNPKLFIKKMVDTIQETENPLRYKDIDILKLSNVESDSPENWRRIYMATEVLGLTLTQKQAQGIIDAHNHGKPPYDSSHLRQKTKILLDAGLSKDSSSRLIRSGITGGGYKSFRVSDPPEVARRIVHAIQVADAISLRSLPPGVTASGGGGTFRASSPTTTVIARLEVRSDGKGGSIVSETFESQARGIFRMPGAKQMVETATDIIHSIVINPARGYEIARRRLGY